MKYRAHLSPLGTPREDEVCLVQVFHDNHSPESNVGDTSRRIWEKTIFIYLIRLLKKVNRVVLVTQVGTTLGFKRKMNTRY